MQTFHQTANSSKRQNRHCRSLVYFEIPILMLLYLSSYSTQPGYKGKLSRKHSYSEKDLIWNGRQWDIIEGTLELKELSVVCEAASAKSSLLSSNEV